MSDPTSLLGPAPSSVPQDTAATDVSPAIPATSASFLPQPTADASVAPTSLPPDETPAPSFQLKGIFYISANPSAIVNGETVYVGEEIDGATVISIGREQVTLEINGEPRTLILRSAY